MKEILDENTEVLHFLQENMVMKEEFDGLKGGFEEFKIETNNNFSSVRSEIHSLTLEIQENKSGLEKTKQASTEDLGAFALDYTRMNKRVKKLERQRK